MDLDRKREEKEKRKQEQRAELLHMKYQTNISILNNLTNNLSSFHEPRFNN